MSLDPLFQQLYDTPVAVAIRESGTLFPWVESVHVLAITLVVGSILAVDLRLVGIAWKTRSISQLTREVLPLTWTAFGVAAITGGLLFSSNAVKYSHNTFFLSKMALLVVAGVNMLAFHLLTSRTIEHWDEVHHHQLPPAVKFAGLASMVLWLAIIICGRWIGFTMSAF